MGIIAIDDACSADASYTSSSSPSIGGIYRRRQRGLTVQLYADIVSL